MNRTLRDELIEILILWNQGSSDHIEVHERAEEMWLEYGEINLERTNPRSIELEVMRWLDSLNVYLVTKDDIPTMLDFLSTNKGEELSGWAKWDDYINSINWRSRSRALSNEPYYISFERDYEE